MNFPFHLQGFYGTHQNAALYFNSMVSSYDYSYAQSQPYMSTIYPLNMTISFLPFNSLTKPQEQSQRATDYIDREEQQQIEIPIKFQIKEEHRSSQQIEPVVEQEQKEESQKIEKIVVIKSKPREKREKNFKKNTQSNLINNVFSYICSQLKSHRELKILVRTPQRSKIFYIFANNLRKLNGKYLNRKNIKTLCEIIPNQAHAKLLAKSVKRLQQLSMGQLRIVLRKIIFNYLRGSGSLLPLLTSKKICKFAMQQHLHKRRELIELMTDELQDYNKEDNENI